MVRTHTVVPGETLSALSLRFYGDQELYRLIATAAGIPDPDTVRIGQRLVFPDFVRYSAIAGDTLAGLATRFYGDAQLDWLISGPSGISRSGPLSAGQRLIIPEITRHRVASGETLFGVGNPFLR